MASIPGRLTSSTWIRRSTPTGTTPPPVGSAAAGTAFKDTWTLSDLDVAWMGWIPVLLDDPFVDWRRCKPCGLDLLPEDQVRVVGSKATLCFHCAMTGLNLEALGERTRMDVSLELLRRLRDGQVYDKAGRFMLADGRVEG